MATAGRDRAARPWDTRTWCEPRSYDWQGGELRAVAFPPGGQTVAVGGEGAVRLFGVDGRGSDAAAGAAGEAPTGFHPTATP